LILQSAAPKAGAKRRLTQKYLPRWTKTMCRWRV